VSPRYGIEVAHPDGYSLNLTDRGETLVYRDSYWAVAASLGWDGTAPDLWPDLGAALEHPVTGKSVEVRRPEVVLTRMIRFLTDDGRRPMVLRFREPDAAGRRVADVLEALTAGAGYAQWSARALSEVAWEFRATRAGA
jgi:hypothetical protein